LLQYILPAAILLQIECQTAVICMHNQGGRVLSES